LLDDLLNGFDLELATMLSGGLAHAIIILAEPHDSNLGVHFSGARSARICVSISGTAPTASRFAARHAN
jgi:hypothetical protein